MMPTKTLAVALAVLTACAVSAYALQVNRPAQLVSSTVSDGPEYVAIAHWIENGRPAGFKTRNTALPSGYPLLIAGCERIGLGLVPLNYLCLAVALAASWFALRRSFSLSLMVTCSILLLVAGSDVFREASLTVASELPFFAATMVAVALMERGTLAALLLAVPVSVAAIFIRTAGVALLPALAWAVATHSLVRPWITRRTLALAAIPALLAAFALSRTEYVSSIIANRYNAGTNWNSIATQQAIKLSTLGELMTSQRAEDFRMAYQAEFVFLGAILAALTVVGLWSRRRRFRPPDVYFAAYAAIMFVYPFFGYGPNRRFWLPILPLLAALAYLGICRLLESLGRRALGAAPQ
jgi:hypothetical protein